MQCHGRGVAVLENYYTTVPLGSSRSEERVGEEIDAIHLEDGGGGPDMGNVDVRVDLGRRHDGGRRSSSRKQCVNKVRKMTTLNVSFC